MSLEPLWAAGPFVVLHTGFALMAFGLGGAQLVLPKGGARHRVMGWIWIGVMLATAATALLIGGLNGLANPNWLHLLIVLTLWGLWGGVRAIRMGDRADHARTMIMVFTGALIIAGAFTLMPGRVLHEVVGL